MIRTLAIVAVLGTALALPAVAEESKNKVERAGAGNLDSVISGISA